MAIACLRFFTGCLPERIWCISVRTSLCAFGPYLRRREREREVERCELLADDRRDFEEDRELRLPELRLLAIGCLPISDAVRRQRVGATGERRRVLRIGCATRESKCAAQCAGFVCPSSEIRAGKRALPGEGTWNCCHTCANCTATTIGPTGKWRVRCKRRVSPSRAPRGCWRTWWEQNGYGTAASCRTARKWRSGRSSPPKKARRKWKPCAPPGNNT